MRALEWWWALMLLLALSESAPSSEDEKAGHRLEEISSLNSIDEAASPAAEVAAAAASSGGLSLQESIKRAEEKEMTEVKEIHRRVVRQLLDGFRLENSLKDGISALENVDEMLRTTLPTLDKFQCLERFMCSVMSSDSSSSSGSPITSLIQQAFDPTFQQGIIQDPSTVSQEILQNPALQGLLPQGQNFQQGLAQAGQQLLSQITSAAQNPVPGFAPPNPAFQQGFPPPNPAFQQGFPPPNPAFQQGFPPPNPAFQQGFPPPNPAFQGFPQAPTLNNPAFPPPPPPPGFNPNFHPQPPQQVFPPFADGTSFQNSFPNFRENPESRSSQRRVNVQRPKRRRRPSRPRQRNGFFDFLGRLGLGRRKKRSVLDDLLGGLGGFTGEGIMGIVDQMLTPYSFYPYSHAAFMGYSGSARRCETLYPSCPSTAEELIDVFNNIHRHYPDGIPYKENFPWPLNVLLP